MSAPDVGEAAAVADDFAKSVGTFPGDGESANAARTHATDSVTCRVTGNVAASSDLRQQFIDQKTGILIAKRVVFEAAVVVAAKNGRPGAFVARVDEKPDGHRHFSLVNQ